MEEIQSHEPIYLEERTALHWAAYYGFTEVVKVILESPHCTKELLDKNNMLDQTALHIACEANAISIEILSLLIKAGADFQGLQIAGLPIATWAQEQLSSAAYTQEQREVAITNLQSIVDNISKTLEVTQDKGVCK